jgi:hypothetical protein
MSWNQDYSVPSAESLLESLVGKSSLQLLQEEALRQGIQIMSSEEILLDSGMYEDVKGIKITLSDGRVFVPKLVEKFTADGNYGNDIYEYVLEGYTPTVKHVDGSYTDDATLKDSPPQYGLTDEAPLESDGEPCTCKAVGHCHCDSDRFCGPECWDKKDKQDYIEATESFPPMDNSCEGCINCCQNCDGCEESPIDEAME